MQASLTRLRQRRQELGNEGGFTLIELLIVIVILGILAAIVVFAVQSLTSQSVAASCGSDYKTVETGLETFKAQVGHYPTDGTAAQTTPAIAAQVGDNFANTPGGTVTSAPTTPPSKFGDGVLALFATQPAPNNTGIGGASTVGPWLKDAPTNGNSYRIWVVPGGTLPNSTTPDPNSLTDGGTVLVQNVSKNPLPSTPANGATVTWSSPAGGDGAAATLTYNSATTQWVASTSNPGINLTCGDASL